MIFGVDEFAVFYNIKNKTIREKKVIPLNKEYGEKCRNVLVNGEMISLG